jgi:uncharacterized protein (TIGR03083 family)
MYGLLTIESSLLQAAELWSPMMLAVAHDPVPQGEQIRVDLDPADVLRAYSRHRTRFAEAMRALDDQALRAPSRCSEWSVADVLRHLVDVDGWMQKLWSGQPLPFTSFDPRVTPHEFVVAGRAIGDAEARDRFVLSTETMAGDVGTSDRERWGTPSISPLGVVPWWLSALHVFWDSWLHERDALLPLGMAVPFERDEALAVLAYGLAIVGMFIGEPTDVVIGGVRLVAGEAPVVTTPVTEPSDAVGTLVDALAGRGDVAAELAGTDPDVVHRLGVLARSFNPPAEGAAAESA